MAYTMKHILIAATAMLAVSMAVVARPQEADCAAILKHPDPKIQCISPNSCSPSAGEAELALNLLAGTPGSCCHRGVFPDCATPVVSQNIAIYVCGLTRQACTPCKEVAQSLRPVLNECKRRGKVDGLVREGTLTFAISKNPSNPLCTHGEM